MTNMTLAARALTEFAAGYFRTWRGDA